MKALQRSTTIHDTIKQKVGEILKAEYMSSEESRLMVVSREAKEEVASGVPTDSRLTGTPEYFTGTRVVKFKMRS